MNIIKLKQNEIYNISGGYDLNFLPEISNWIYPFFAVAAAATVVTIKLIRSKKGRASAKLASIAAASATGQSKIDEDCEGAFSVLVSPSEGLEGGARTRHSK
jgi:hypothetical protein